MNDLYWLTVLGNLNTLCIIACTLAVLAIIAFGSILVADRCENGPLDKRILRWFYMSLVFFFLCTTGLVLTPTVNQVYAIYGVGSVIDYCKDSGEAKKLPDNAVKAINKYLESINKEEDK